MLIQDITLEITGYINHKTVAHDSHGFHRNQWGRVFLCLFIKIIFYVNRLYPLWTVWLKQQVEAAFPSTPAILLETDWRSEMKTEIAVQFSWLRLRLHL